MKILGIDSSSMVASVAIVEDGELIAEYTVNFKKTHSQTLLPMLDEVKNMIDLDLQSIDGIAVAAGPGSFTGLRIGSATAKGLAQALNKPIIAIPTIDGMAYNLYGTDKMICPMMDARRNQTYAGLYEFQAVEKKNDIKQLALEDTNATLQESKNAEIEYELKVIQEQSATTVVDILEEINKIGREVIFLGDGIPVFREQIREKCQVSFSFAPPICNRQRAGSIASLGLSYYKKGLIQTAEEHEPNYLRITQAERERLGKQSD